MKILFSFESSRIPVRSATFINWLIHRGHIVHVLYDESVCHEPMSHRVYLKHIKVINSSKLIHVQIPSLFIICIILFDLILRISFNIQSESKLSVDVKFETKFLNKISVNLAKRHDF